MQAEIGVIGGSGFYSLFDQAESHRIDTPYGPPSDELRISTIGDRTVAFLPRHGREHQYPPHRINYRANLWALRAVGVRQILAPCAVGSLRPELGPGTIVVPDQVIDQTSGRVQTYFDTGAVHVPFADPYCTVARPLVAAHGAVDGGTMVVIEGPRFSSRAESEWYAGQGWSLVNMTGLPEAVLARELALCYLPVALVTDLDAGIDSASAVTQEEVFTVFGENIARLRELVLAAIPDLPAERKCPCSAAHDGLTLPFELP